MRPKHIFLNLFVIDFPLTALTSIAHRVTGMLLFISIPFILYFLKLSLESESSFEISKILISKIYIKTFLMFLYLSFLYHIMNGIKHIIMDLGFFENKTSAKNISLAAIILTILFFILSILI